MRVFDPVGHEEMPLEQCEGLYEHRKIDRRWVRIRRPTIIVGGELTMSSLEVMVNSTTGICEAPLQIKGNCGTLVIDDFGRQRMPVEELLNRWIVPLERRHDFLNMPNGRENRSAVRPLDHFLHEPGAARPRGRGLPAADSLQDRSGGPVRRGVRASLPHAGGEDGLSQAAEALEYMIEKHFVPKKRPFRYCHPRDLLMQIRNYCSYKDCELDITNEFIDMAVENYFSVM